MNKCFKLFCIIIIILLSLSWLSCTPKNKSIYIVGNEDCNIESICAVYWKDGIKTVLSTNESGAEFIYVSDSDVYAAGFEDGGNAVYWKNGEKTILPEGSIATSIYLY